MRTHNAKYFSFIFLIANSQNAIFLSATYTSFNLFLQALGGKKKKCFILIFFLNNKNVHLNIYYNNNNVQTVQRFGVWIMSLYCESGKVLKAKIKRVSANLKKL